MSEAEQPIPKSDLPTRLVMGVVLIVVACAAIWFGGWPFRLLVWLGTAVMLAEWADMHRVPRRFAYAGAVLLALNLIVAPRWLVSQEIDAVWPGFALIVVAALLLGAAARRLTMAGGYLYVAIPAFALLAMSHFGYGFTFWLMIVTWATDIFAYFAGRSIGGPKLAPRVSPNKTWAGLIGGMLGAAVCGAIAASAFGLGRTFFWTGALMGLIAQGGDLYESWLKRRAGVKDSGTILPGHGGALDRLDGLLPVIVATFIMLALGAGPG